MYFTYKHRSKKIIHVCEIWWSRGPLTKRFHQRRICGFPGGALSVCTETVFWSVSRKGSSFSGILAFLGSYAPYSGNSYRRFGTTYRVPFWRAIALFLGPWNGTNRLSRNVATELQRYGAHYLKDGPIGCHETSVQNCHSIRLIYPWRLDWYIVPERQYRIAPLQDSLTLEDGPIGCHETSVENYNSTGLPDPWSWDRYVVPKHR
jgi:hypothetical protein